MLKRWKVQGSLFFKPKQLWLLIFLFKELCWTECQTLSNKSRQFFFTTQVCGRAPPAPAQTGHSPLPSGEQNPEAEQIHSAGWWPDPWENIRLRTERCASNRHSLAQLKSYLGSTASIPTLFSTQKSWQLPNMQVSELWDEKHYHFLSVCSYFPLDDFVIPLVCLSQYTFVDLLFVSYTLRFPKYYRDNHLAQLIFLEITDASEMNSYCVWRKCHRAVKTGKPAVHLRHLS